MWGGVQRRFSAEGRGERPEREERLQAPQGPGACRAAPPASTPPPTSETMETMSVTRSCSSSISFQGCATAALFCQYRNSKSA